MVSAYVEFFHALAGMFMMKTSESITFLIQPSIKQTQDIARQLIRYYYKKKANSLFFFPSSNNIFLGFFVTSAMTVPLIAMLASSYS